MRPSLARRISFLLSALFFSAIPLTQAGWLYDDLDDDHIYFLAISQLSAQEAIEGYDDGTYKADQAINRAEFLKIALSWYNEDVATIDLTGSDCYLDVEDEWFAPYVCAATELGMVEGYPDGFFHPERSINFAEASKIIANVFNLPVMAEETENWYHPYVEALATERLIAPTIVSFVQEVDRGEMAEMIYWATSSSQGKWDTTYDELQAGALEHYRVAYSSPGASTSYAYLIAGTESELLGDVQAAAVNPGNTRLAYMQYEAEDDWSNLGVKDLASDEMLIIFPELEAGEMSGFGWSDDGLSIRWTAISYENTDFNGVVVVTQAGVTSGDVVSFETNSLFHCGASCYPYPFVWAEGEDYGAIMTYDYDDETTNDEHSYFLIYNSLGQEIGLTASLTRINEEPWDYTWNETGEALIAEYADGSTESVTVVWTE